MLSMDVLLRLIRFQFVIVITLLVLVVISRVFRIVLKQRNEKRLLHFSEMISQIVSLYQVMPPKAATSQCKAIVGQQAAGEIVSADTNESNACEASVQEPVVAVAMSTSDARENSEPTQEPVVVTHTACTVDVIEGAEAVQVLDEKMRFAAVEESECDATASESVAAEEASTGASSECKEKSGASEAKETAYDAAVNEHLAELTQKSNRYFVEKVLAGYLSQIDFDVAALDLSNRIGIGASLADAFEGSIKERDLAYQCRRMGIFRAEGCLQYINMAMSDEFTSDVQRQGLLAVARYGNAESMSNAFNVIHNNIVINYRTVSDILEYFRGDKIELFQTVLIFHSEYIKLLFLKSMKPEMVERLIPEIKHCLESPNNEVRLAALKMYCRTADESVGEVLVKHLADSHWENRATAAKCLGTYLYPPALDVLADLLHDKEWWVRQNAAETLIAYADGGAYIDKVLHSGDDFAISSINYVLKRHKGVDQKAG